MAGNHFPQRNTWRPSHLWLSVEIQRKHGNITVYKNWTQWEIKQNGMENRRLSRNNHQKNGVCTVLWSIITIKSIQKKRWPIKWGYINKIEKELPVSFSLKRFKIYTYIVHVCASTCHLNILPLHVYHCLYT